MVLSTLCLTLLCLVAIGAEYNVTQSSHNATELSTDSKVPVFTTTKSKNLPSTSEPILATATTTTKGSEGRLENKNSPWPTAKTVPAAPPAKTTQTSETPPSVSTNITLVVTVSIIIALMVAALLFLYKRPNRWSVSQLRESARGALRAAGARLGLQLCPHDPETPTGQEAESHMEEGGHPDRNQEDSSDDYSSLEGVNLTERAKLRVEEIGKIKDEGEGEEIGKIKDEGEGEEMGKIKDEGEEIGKIKDEGEENDEFIENSRDLKQPSESPEGVEKKDCDLTVL